MQQDQVGFTPGFNICQSINVTYHINKMKDKNYVMISTDAEKALDIHLWFKKKNLSKVGMEALYLSIIKIMYDRLTAYLTPDWKIFL